MSTATYVKLSSPTKLARVGVYVNDPVEPAPTAIVTSPCDAAVNELTASGEPPTSLSSTPAGVDPAVAARVWPAAAVYTSGLAVGEAYGLNAVGHDAPSLWAAMSASEAASTAVVDAGDANEYKRSSRSLKKYSAPAESLHAALNACRGAAPVIDFANTNIAVVTPAPSMVSVAAYRMVPLKP